MENGRGLDLGLLPELADSLECTVTYLLGMSVDPHSWFPDHLAPTADRVPPRNGRPTGLRRTSVETTGGELP